MNAGITSAATLVPIAVGALLPAEGTQEFNALVWILGLAAAAVMFNQISDAWQRMTGKFRRQGDGAAEQRELEKVRQEFERKLEVRDDVLARKHSALRHKVESLATAWREDLLKQTEGLNARLTSVQTHISHTSEKVSGEIGTLRGHIDQLNLHLQKQRGADA